MKNFNTEEFWYIKQLHIFRDLSEADAYALAQIITFRDLKHEERISEEGVYLIKEGRVKIAENLPDTDSDKNTNSANNSDKDESQETKEVLEQGEIFGVTSVDGGFWNANSEPLTYAETLTEVCIGFATIRDFSFYLKRKPHLALPMLRRTRLGIFNATILRYGNKLQDGQLGSHDILKRVAIPNHKHANAFGNIAFRTVSSRLALLLQHLSTVSDNNGNIFAPRLSNKRISELIGSSMETIDTLLNTFKQYNVIETRRGRIQIMNAWKLKKIADARMKTLTPRKVPTTTSDLENDLEMFGNLQNENRIESGSDISSA